MVIFVSLGVRSAVKLRDVVKRYSDVTAVGNVSLDVQHGEIFSLLGPNGSGKTTTLEMIIGLEKPDSGSVRVLGMDREEDSVEVKKRLGYVPESPHLYEFLTGIEYLDFVGDIYGLDHSEKEKRINEYLEAFELEGKEGDMIKSYSGGMKQKISLISVFIHEPEVLLLDEPLSGLDPKSAKIVKDLLRELASQGVAVIVSTHVLEIAQAISDRIAIMREGKLLAQGDMEELRERAKMPGSDLEDIFLRLTGSEDIRAVVEALLE